MNWDEVRVCPLKPKGAEAKFLEWDCWHSALVIGLSSSTVLKQYGRWPVDYSALPPEEQKAALEDFVNWFNLNVWNEPGAKTDEQVPTD